MKTYKARAHTNIALIKYWGKRDEELILPVTNSLSLTLDKFYTDTTVSFSKELEHDTVYINEKLLSKEESKRINNFLNLVRDMSGCNYYALVKSINNVPTAAGLASSASGFAALSGAASSASGLKLNNKELSMLARRGSGSACRSIYGGLVEWQDTHAFPIENNKLDLSMLFVIINRNKKSVSSREGMKRTVSTSPFYKVWPEIVKEDLKDIKKAISDGDFTKMGEVTESNSLKMHATMLGARPPFFYFEPETIKVLKHVEELRNLGIECYFTMDAGPNVKILSESHNIMKIKEYFLNYFEENRLIVAKPGPGISITSI